jgi:hypothetical protein
MFTLRGMAGAAAHHRSRGIANATNGVHQHTCDRHQDQQPEQTTTTEAEDWNEKGEAHSAAAVATPAVAAAVAPTGSRHRRSAEAAPSHAPTAGGISRLCLEEAEPHNHQGQK